MSKLIDAIDNLKKVLSHEGIDPINGLPLELFEFNTGLLPFINVDLLVVNANNQVLLSWRDDKHYGKGWQIPGGIIRMMETIEDRIQKTGTIELGHTVEHDNEPMVVYEHIVRNPRAGLDNQLERAHNIALLYKCWLPGDYVINNHDKDENEEGYLRWFDKFPENILECHKILANYEKCKGWF